MDKAYYRCYAKEFRKTLDVVQVSLDAVEKIRKHPLYQASRRVMLFYPTKYEINLLDLLNDNKDFYLPKVEGNNLLVCPYTDNLELSEYKIMEPKSTPVSPEVLDLVIVPALMGDGSGFRLGYGGGYYDRFLKTCGAKRLTVLPKQMIVDELPSDSFDEKVEILEI